MEAAHTTWRPLGELIVERGLVTDEQLEDALLEQRITRKRLGTILIDKGIVSAQQLTDALVDQIGVEDLLDEFDRTEAASEDEDNSSRPFGGSLRRFRDRLQEVEMPSPRRLATPFSRLRARTAELARRNADDNAPVAPFTPSFAVEADVPSPELVEPEPAAEPHAWLTALRHALEQAESELTRLDNAAVARAHELDEARSELSALQAQVARESTAHRQAEEEIGRLHALIDERDAGLTQMEASVEELRTTRAAVEAELAELRTATEAEISELRAANEADVNELRAAKDAELAGALSQLELAGSELDAARRESAERHARLEELEATLKDYERRGTRIAELEAQTAELAENLSATDETLGIEMHAREQAQRESKRLQDELDDRDARVAKLVRQVEALEAELQVVVAERAQAQRKLQSRERRVAKLESTLAELHAAPGAPVAEPEETTPAESEPEEQAPETEAAAEQPEAQAETDPEPSAAEAEQPVGFLYFVPRTGEGYELVEHEGQTPAVGDQVEVEGQAFEVTRHSRSPLPFDRRVCVYLRTAG